MVTEDSPEGRTSQRKTRIGLVVSDKMDKTVVVSITRRFMHTKYKKYVKERLKYKVHDENNECAIGDKVLIEETRPLSRHKHWRVKQILEKAPVV
ncbi:MAG: 30S ribosomal protein S17 [Bradymonadaceae bacterium]|nr:30S ribosomal protein S17 [Lujinxingiaceae bacterium]